MKIKADLDTCIGAGQCALVAPELFDQSEEDGTVIVLHNTPSADLEAKAEEAVQLCPSGALSLG